MAETHISDAVISLFVRKMSFSAVAANRATYARCRLNLPMYMELISSDLSPENDIFLTAQSMHLQYAFLPPGEVLMRFED